MLTNDEAMFNKMLLLRNHGSPRKYHHEYIGHNYRMEGLQGAVLDIKLKYLPEWTERRRRNSALYRELLAGVEEVVLPQEMPGAGHVYHLFVIRIRKRDELLGFLEEHEISAGIHYPVPCHLQKAYGFLNYRPGSFPLSEKYADEVLSLPMYAELKEDEICYVSEKIRDFFKR